uniref:Uncharacterized protein n=1 Tax=Sciurus vulgaris TaxID=55149 RepID=A0A8D2AXX1_SCIVU
MKVSKFASVCTMGANASALKKEIGPEEFPVNEHYFGLREKGRERGSTETAMGQILFHACMIISKGTHHYA